MFVISKQKNSQTYIWYSYKNTTPRKEERERKPGDRVLPLKGFELKAVSVKIFVTGEGSHADISTIFHLHVQSTARDDHVQSLACQGSSPLIKTDTYTYWLMLCILRTPFSLSSCPIFLLSLPYFWWLGFISCKNKAWQIYL